MQSKNETAKVNAEHQTEPAKSKRMWVLLSGRENVANFLPREGVQAAQRKYTDKSL